MYEHVSNGGYVCTCRSVHIRHCGKRISRNQSVTANVQVAYRENDTSNTKK